MREKVPLTQKNIVMFILLSKDETKDEMKCKKRGLFGVRVSFSKRKDKREDSW